MGVIIDPKDLPADQVRQVYDYDFHFLGGVMLPITLRPDLGDHADFPKDAQLIVIHQTDPLTKQEEDAVIERRNLLWFCKRPRLEKIPQPKKPPLPPPIVD